MYVDKYIHADDLRTFHVLQTLINSEMLLIHLCLVVQKLYQVMVLQTCGAESACDASAGIIINTFNGHMTCGADDCLRCKCWYKKKYN